MTTWYDTGTINNTYIMSLHDQLVDATMQLRRDAGNHEAAEQVKIVSSKIKSYQFYANQHG